MESKKPLARTGVLANSLGDRKGAGPSKLDSFKYLESLKQDAQPKINKEDP